MTQVAAVSILALTVSLALGRPRIGRLRFDHARAAVLGAVLCLATGLLPPEDAWDALVFLVRPVVTIVSLMVITLVAEQSGLFDQLARRLAVAARGDPRRLFTYLFIAGSVTGTVFTNDAAVLIFTPIVFKLVDEIRDETWSLTRRLPFYFAVLYVANVAGALVISNPINIIVSDFFDIGFGDYALWMALPAVASIVASYAGIRFFFRNDFPTSFRPVELAPSAPGQRAAMASCGAVLGLSLVAFLSEPLTGIPTWVVAFGAAAILLALHQSIGATGYQPVIRGVGWDVIVFVVGIYLVATSLRSNGLTEGLAGLLARGYGGEVGALSHTVAFTAAGLSAVMNNHPTAGTMAMTLQQMGLPEFQTKILAFAALIGGDLGPKMLPIGSLAALMWFRILRNRGVEVSYWLYIRIGVPVTLAAILISVLTLDLEVRIFEAWH